jgi:hypothetical protein
MMLVSGADGAWRHGGTMMLAAWRQDQVRLDTQDQLTAIPRLLDDVWKATGSTIGHEGVERTRQALGLYLEAPSEATWEGLADVLAGLLSPEAARPVLADLAPYVR